MSPEVGEMADAEARRHLSFRQAAEQILREAMTPLKPDEIVKRALADGLITTSGKTPIASMGSPLYTEIQQHGEESAFVKYGRGEFGLREWSFRPPPPMVPIV